MSQLALRPHAFMGTELLSSPQASHDDASQAQRRSSDVEVPRVLFQYLRPLREREIRLLKIEHRDTNSSDDGVIGCRLTYHTLDELTQHPPDEEGVLYIALSYAWGNFDISHTIKCDGLDLAVSKTLHSALIRLSATTTWEGPKRKIPEVLVWIDAICINQSDAVEKSNQVRMMKTIYGHAVAVVAWLGEEEETDQQSLESMGKLVRALESHDQPQDQTGAHEVEQQPMAHSSLAVVADSDAGAIFADPRLPSDLPDADSPEWDHFLHLLEKPWFSRVWIVQEFVAANYFEFLCGGTLIEARLVFEPINMLLQSRTLCTQIMMLRPTKGSFINGNKLCALKQKIKTKNHPSLLTVLSQTVHFEATDVRDKVFAVLGLSNDNNRDLIDYTDELRKVLINTARRLLESENGSLEMLSWAHAVDRTDKLDLPSWVTDWSCNKTVMIPLATIFPCNTKISENRAYLCHSEANEKYALVVDCQTITYISKMNLIRQDLRFTLDFFLPLYSQLKKARGSPMAVAILHKLLRKLQMEPRFFNHLQQFVTSLPSYPTGQQMSEVYWRSLVFDDEGTAPAQWGRDIEWMCKVGGLLEKGVDPFDAVPEISTLLEIDEEVFYLLLGIRATMWSCGVGALVALAGVLKSIRARSLPSFRTVTLFIPALTVFTLTSVLFSNLICQCWFEVFPSRGPKSSRETFRKTPKIDYDLVDRVLRLAGRQLCITHNGYVAWAPETAQAGDQICRLRGSRLPFVIRSQEQNRDLPSHPKVVVPKKAAPEREIKSYKLIGDCYIHGMMGDEALDMQIGRAHV